MWTEPYFANTDGSGSSRIGLSRQESGRDPHIAPIGPVPLVLASGEGHERIAHACGHETDISSIPIEVAQGFFLRILRWGEADVDQDDRSA